LQRKEVRQQEQMYEGKKGVNINRWWWCESVTY
jgi:hypothetical protein